MFGFGHAACVAGRSSWLALRTYFLHTDWLRGARPIPRSVIRLMQPYFPTLDLAEIRIVPVRFWPQRAATWPFSLWVDDHRAMTMGTRIYWKGEFDPTDCSGDLRLLMHELVHVEQYERMGALTFACRYARSLAGRANINAVRYEIEANSFVSEHGDEMEERCRESGVVATAALRQDWFWLLWG